jgi:hypothetical protein
LGIKIKIGGPAYNDRGDEFTPGLYVRYGYTITSRGCPNKCWFCSVPKREGLLRELKIHDGYNLLDSNILACSDQHIKNVFSMLCRQKEKPKFTGGLEAKLLNEWKAFEILKLKPTSAYFAWDTPDDFEPLLNASIMLKKIDPLFNSNKVFFVYCLIGYPKDTLSNAETRLNQILQMGFLPMAMLYNRRNDKDWRRLQREYANKVIVSSKFNKVR